MQIIGPSNHYETLEISRKTCFEQELKLKQKL